MSTGPNFTFSLTTVAAVAVIVACSPNNSKLAIGVRGPTAFQNAINACTDSLRSSQKVKPQAGTRTVQICEFPLKADGTIADKTVPATTDVSFSIQKVDDAKGRTIANQVNLGMTIGFLPNVAIDDKEKIAFLSAFKDDCQLETQEIFSRSRFGGPVQLQLSLEFQFDDNSTAFPTSASNVETETKTETDHELRIEKHIEKQTAGADTFWTLNQLPSLPKYYPSGKLADNQSCGAAGGSRKAQQDCRLERRKVLNLPVCAAFAKRVGNALGIVDAAKEYASCGAVQAAVALADRPRAADFVLGDVSGDVANDLQQLAAEAKPTPRLPQDSSFAKPTASDDEFIKHSELNKKDLLTILAPACPNLKDAK